MRPRLAHGALADLDAVIARLDPLPALGAPLTLGRLVAIEAAVAVLRDLRAAIAAGRLDVDLGGGPDRDGSA